MNIDVSVVLTNWNTRKLLEECLRSVTDKTEVAVIEIIVVDNASSDKSVEAIRSQFPQVLVIKNSTNLGFARACNQGIQASKGRYVLLLNTDTLLLNDAISKSMTYSDSHPECAVLGCRVFNADRSIQETTFMFPSLLNLLLETLYLNKLFPSNKFFGRSRMTWWSRGETRPVDVVTGCFMLIRREAIEMVGVLDDSFFMYGEETDYCYRAYQKGWQVVYAPFGEIVHLGGQSSKRARTRMILQLRSSVLQYFHKHSPWYAYWLACILTSGFFLVRIPYWVATGVVQRSSSRLLTAFTYVQGFCRALWGWKALSTKPA